MSQQKPNRTSDDSYKRRLFYDNGIRFVEVNGRMTGEYNPPTPILKVAANVNIQSSSSFINKGTSHYTASIQMIFYSKEDYADWLHFIGAEHKYYDEKGTIYVGVVSGELGISKIESKFIITVPLLLVRKQEKEFRPKYGFIDVENHWAEKYIDEMQQRGIIATTYTDGSYVEYFKPDNFITRCETMNFMVMTYKHIDKVLRGFWYG